MPIIVYVPLKQKMCPTGSTTPEAFAEAMLPLLRRDSYASFIHKVYATALRAANARQKVQLKAAVTRHHIKIKP